MKASKFSVARKVFILKQGGMRRLCPIDFGFALELLRFRSFDK